MLADFVRYCEIESPSGREREVADALTDDLRGLGLEVEEDEAGNLLARIAGPEGAPTVLLCAHMDTVPLDGPVEVVSENGLLTEPPRGHPRRRQQGRDCDDHGRRAADRA